ncbi:DUF5683 domain-containing protein [Cyclobacterium marinum]|uniref:DUF5683 domain-containing protein n=1 Tax=Cyclobacterium marinum (strain ATCC 25205 / DSM 745 / LMG 13164 / NCIMB 1802) TaxID=880070 RepID=G0IYV5_CYCMS|nr:DUF5683 domain-containing protein [Cyclobacterium marinum]AEL28100.1 hypothetical protein Cycma_4398 [Cyclobacterium marinum DSM 745]
MANKNNPKTKHLHIVLGFLCLFLVHSATAQEIDSNDSLTDSIGFEAPKNVKDPKKAIYLSLIFPGAGQVYNEKVWKLPLLYSGVSTAIYFLNFNNRRYKEFIAALEIVREGTETNPFPNLNEDGIIRNVNYWRRNRDAMYMVFGAIYALGAVDAFVDAHLSGFDVSDDLTFKLEPSMEPMLANNSAIGLSLKIKF